MNALNNLLTLQIVKYITKENPPINIKYLLDQEELQA